jgi:hypothetical protein
MAPRKAVAPKAMPRKSAPRKAAPVKLLPRSAAPKEKPIVKRTVAELEAEIELLRQQVDFLMYMDAERHYQAKVVAAQQIMQRPEVRQKIQEMIIAKMIGNG